MDLFPAEDFGEDIHLSNCHGNKKKVVADRIAKQGCIKFAVNIFKCIRF